MLRLCALLMMTFFRPQSQVFHKSEYTPLLDVSVVVHGKGYQIAKNGEVHYYQSGCSGTFVSSTTILTAAHCFDEPTSEIWVRDNAHKSMRCRLKKVDYKHDLALLSVNGKIKHKFAKVGKYVGLGEHITNIGSPPPFEFLASEGGVALTNYRLLGEPKESIGIDATYLVTTAVIKSGSSGGGVFNDRHELIGVNTMVTGFFGTWEGITLAVDATTIQAFLKPAPKSSTVIEVIMQ